MKNSKYTREFKDSTVQLAIKRNSVKYAWIHEHKKSFNITLMCRSFQVNKSSYYHWVKSGCVVKKVDNRLNELIKIIFVQSRQTYGTRRIKDKLAQLYRLVVSRKKIRNIMQDLNLIVKMKRRFKVNTTDSNHDLPIAPNILNRNFYTSLPDTKYCSP